MASQEEKTSEATDTNSRVVLIAVDASPQAEYALKFYASHIHSPDKHPTILYVAEAPPLPMKSEMRHNYTDTDTWEDLMKAETRHAEQVKNKFSQKLKELKMQGEIKTIFHNKPGEAIVEEAGKMKAMLIVTGTRGMGKIRRTVFGSVSDYVLHHADCPVLISRM